MQNHQLLEKMVLRQIQLITETEDYTRLLDLFYSYFGALELLIAEYISPEYLPDLSKRRKADLITQDILSLNGRVPQLSESTALPVIKNNYQAFGALYVIEGSSLGGIHIAKMIQKKLPGIDAFLFFSGYGDKTHEKWNQFKHILDQLPGSPANINQIITGALDTFLKFAEWIRSNIKSEVQT